MADDVFCEATLSTWHNQLDYYQNSYIAFLASENIQADEVTQLVIVDRVLTIHYRVGSDLHEYKVDLDWFQGSWIGG